MSESILNALMQLFAIVANADEEEVSEKARQIVQTYLRQHLNKQFADEYLQLFENYLDFYRRDTHLNTEKRRKRGAATAVKVLKICEKINASLHQKEKVIVFMRLLEFIYEDERISENEKDFIVAVADTFKIDQTEYNDLNAFVQDRYEDMAETNMLVINNDTSDDEAPDGLWFEKNRPKNMQQQRKHIYNENMEGQLVILHITSINLYLFRYQGKSNIYLKNNNILPGTTYILDHGAIIKGPRIRPIYFSNITGQFMEWESKAKIFLHADNVEFRFKNSENGVKNFSLFEESGYLVGIMGGSGVGKSTFLNVLNGKLPPNEGKVTINGYDIHQDRQHLEGIIGYVPQDDLLIEELTVFQNLYFNAKLCFSNYSDQQIIKTITQILYDLDLYEIKDLTVGNPLKKFISGGQRKRLNIGLELMREPSVLFVDEPTSGLSSMDSETVMLLLKQQTLRGRLVVVNIHQPSSEIFKLFDKVLIMDKGGRLIYNGNPIDAVVYFKQASNHINADESECPTCGNVNAEQILQIVEEKVVDEYGKFTRERRINAAEWYDLYKQKQQVSVPEEKDGRKQRLPQNNFSVPDEFKQFEIFSLRNILSKLTNKQYLLINFLEAPLLAVILGYFTKYLTEGSYIFSENKNLPIYLFMSIVVALFLGLTVSAEEIIKDRRIRERESFLNLSHFAYINSKVFILFIISAIQMLSFVLVGNLILEIKGLTWQYWLILFTTAASGNLVGLNISSALNSVINIYILIPFILVPQLLLGGAMVDFDDLHDSLRHEKYVPVVGDLMTSRWAYEALAVAQFKNNAFEQHFFEYDRKISYYTFQASFLLPELKALTDASLHNLNNGINQQKTRQNLRILSHEIRELEREVPTIFYTYYENLTPETFHATAAQQTKVYLDSLMEYFREKQSMAKAQRDSVVNALTEEHGREWLVALKEDFHNEKLADFMQNKMNFTKIKATGNELIAKKDPVLMYPESNWGRAHFYAPVKIIWGRAIDTILFNISVIWLITVLLYIALLGSWLHKILHFFARLRWKK